MPSGNFIFGATAAILLGGAVLLMVAGFARYGSVEPCRMFAVESALAAERNGLDSPVQMALARSMAAKFAALMTPEECLKGWARALAK